MKKIAAVLFSALALAFVPVSPALALKPELVLPEKVASTHKACQEIMRLGKKYSVEEVFSKEFQEGKCELNRLDVAVAVQLLTERVADRAAKEGPSSVDKEDLALLADLREELRGEMLLAQARAFQNRYTELGTNLHAITKNITMSGGMTGVVQGSAGNKPKDHVDAVGRADVVFNFRVGTNTIAVIDLEATGGSGIDDNSPERPGVKNFSILNNVPLPPTNTVRFRTAWVEQTFLDERLIFTVGKISLTDYFDSNNVANNENTQFLSAAFVNSHVLGAPQNGPGARVSYRPNEKVTFSLGYGSGDATANDVADHGYGIAELDYKMKIFGREGNYRAYGSVDGARPVDGGLKLAGANSLGTGLSVDQQLTENLTIFARYGWRDRDIYNTHAAWSAGFQYAGLIPSRKDDLLAFAYGQILPRFQAPSVDATGQEKLVEAYYRIKVTDQIAVSPHLQYLMNPLGNRDADNVFVGSVRGQVTF